MRHLREGLRWRGKLGFEQSSNYLIFQNVAAGGGPKRLGLGARPTAKQKSRPKKGTKILLSIVAHGGKKRS